MLYSILVADDSGAERDCVAFLIRKYQLPLEVTVACNGSEALEQLRRERFDILFTDIKMPFLDGLALSRAALELRPEQKIIIFSGYNEFEYAKTAMGLGVRDYLLKPLAPEEFLQVLKKVIAEITEDRKLLALQEQHQEFMHSHLLLMVLNNIPPQSLAGPKDEPSSMQFLSDYCRLVLLELRSDFFSSRGVQFESYLRKHLRLSLDYLNVSPNQSALFLKKPDGFCSEEWLRDRLKRLAQSVSRDYGEFMYIAFSESVTPATIGNCYRDLELTLELRFFFPSCQVFYNGMESAGDISHNSPISLELIETDLQLRDYNRLREHLEYLFSGLRDAPRYSELYIKFLFSSVVKDILALLPAERAESLESVIEEIYRSVSIRRLEQVVLDAVALLETSVPSLTTHASRTEAVKQYIYKHYKDDLSLDILAQEVYIHPDYLCRIFKQETGTTLSKFIKAYRLERARELLEGSRMRIRDVCESVGYQNVSYFSQSFRDHFGVSPERLRQQEKGTAS